MLVPRRARIQEAKKLISAKQEMGGNKKSFFSFFSIFRSKKSATGGDDTWDEAVKAYKVYPSDQDRGGRWADPRIDSKASAYIDDRTNKWNTNDVSS
ncbi:unnamed protein product [Lactuca saligna]|uniref:Uncharacterized protein n=1 Tax=Lactuca saligna TaxID=75948 RepID=A0AA35V392_LACSI|nr:unnamed protein product [Lactuca saligna]